MAATSVAAAVLLFGLYGWRLGSLTPYSGEEVAAKGASATLDALIQNPVNLPHKLLQFGAQQLGLDGPLSLRAVSVVFALLLLGCFFVVVKWWFDRRVALLSSVALAASPMLVIAARSATPRIMLAGGLMVCVAVYLWVLAAERTLLAALLCLTVATALAAYIPGMIWVLATGIIFFLPRLLSIAARLYKLLPYGLVLLWLTLISPIAWSSYRNPDLLNELLLIPPVLLPLGEAVAEIIWTGLGLVWRTRDNLPSTLGTLPVLGIFPLVMAVFGIASIFSQYRRRRSYVLVALVGIVIVVSGLREQFELILIILPLLYIFVAAGIQLLLKEWFTIFPRNPFARALALMLFGLTLGVHLLYGARYSLLAWPQAPETRQQFMLE